MATSKVDPSKEMGLQDDIFYTSVEAPVDSYPRIKYFQSRLKDIFTRLQRLYEPIPESLKRSQHDSRNLSDAVNQLADSNPVVFLFGAMHSKIPKDDLVQESGHTKVETHLLEELAVKEKKQSLFTAVCTLRMIETQKGKDTLMKLKHYAGAENMLFFVDAKYETDKDLVVNNLEILRKFLKHKVIVVYQSKNELSTAISDHMEHSFIKQFRLLNHYLIEDTLKKRYSFESIIGHENAVERLAATIIAFCRTPLAIIDLLLTVTPKPSEKILTVNRATKIAIVRCTKTVLLREVVSKYKVKVDRVSEYLEEIKFDEGCMRVLEESKDVEKSLSKDHPLKPNLIAKLQDIPIEKRSSDGIMDLLSESGPGESRRNLYRKRNERKNRLQSKFRSFWKATANEASKILLKHILDICSKFKGIRSKLDALSYLREELARVMEQTIDDKKSAEALPNLQNWTDLLGRIKEVKAIGHVFGNLCVFVREPEAGERVNEVLRNIRRCLVDYPGEIRIDVCSDSFYAGGDSIESSKQIAMGDAFMNGNCCGTIGLFMNKNGNESEDLHFVTCNHAVLQSEDVTTIDSTRIPLGRRAHSVNSENRLLDISVIQVHPNMKDRCNPFFQDNNKTRRGRILDMKSIQSLTAPGVFVSKRGATSKLTKGCIICKDFTQFGVQKHNIMIGVPIGSDEETLRKGFAQEGDSGAVVYTEAPNGEIQYMSVLMGRFEAKNIDDEYVQELQEMFGPLILTSCLCEGLDQIQKMFHCKLALPEPK